jgi:hypothetical protein
MLPIFFYHNAAQSLAHKGFRRIVTPPGGVDISKREFFDILFMQCSDQTLEKKPTIVFGKKEVVTLQLIF